MPLIPGNRYTKSDLYTIFNVPGKRQKGSWNTGYLKYEEAVYIFANIGVAGRTGHDYDNHWKSGDLVWFGKTGSHVNQSVISYMLKPFTTVYLFTRENDRDPFTYQGLATPKHVFSDEVPVKIIWQINKTQFLVDINEPSEAILRNGIKEAKNDDITKRIIKGYLERKGQRKFCDNLFKACNAKCCITGCSIEEVLQACHIIPHAETGNNNTANGLLLRSDIHDLFDAHLIGIHPITLKVHVKKSLRKTEYADLHGKPLLPRLYKGPDKDALKRRWQLFRSHNE